MKRKGVLCVSILGMMFLLSAIIQPQASGGPTFYAMPRYGVTPQGMIPGMIPPQAQPPTFYSAQPFAPAQQVCSRQAGWQWRPDGFAMCFHPGNLPCPQGHPWTRRATEHYTVCLSMENPAWVFPGSMVF